MLNADDGLDMFSDIYGDGEFFIDTSTRNNVSNSTVNGIDTSSGNSWALFSGREVEWQVGVGLSYEFPANERLEVGETFMLDIDFGQLPYGGDVRFSIKGNTGAVMGFLYDTLPWGNPLTSLYYGSDGGQFDIKFHDDGFHLEMIMIDNNTYSISLLDLQSGEIFFDDSVSLGTETDYFDEFSLFVGNAGNTDDSIVFFNNIRIIPEPNSIINYIFGMIFLLLYKYKKIIY